MAEQLEAGSRQVSVDPEASPPPRVDESGPVASSVVGDTSPVAYPAAAPPPMVDNRTQVVARQHAVAAGGLPTGLALIGLLTIAIGAWGAIVPYIGPTFGYRANGSASWVWAWQHSLLYLIPGAVAVATGLWMWAMAARTRAGAGRLGSAFAGVVLLATGSWFALGPLVWPIFYSTPVFTPASPLTNFLHQLGYNIGPGLVLATLAGMTLASAAVRRRRA
jgi:hypothetical protein